MLITAALALVQLLAASFKLDKTPQGTPSPISNAIAKLIALNASDPQLLKPNSVQNILTDLMTAMNALDIILPPDIAIHIESVQKIVESSQANIANIANGQTAIIGNYTESIDGKPVVVDVFAMRRDSKTNVATDLGLN